MSVHAYSWAWTQPLAGTDKLVLLALADHSNPDGMCWPSHARLARMIGRHRSTVMRSIDHLIELHLLTKVPGQGRSNTYRLMFLEPTLPPEPTSQPVGNHVDNGAGVSHLDATGGVAPCDTHLLHDATGGVAPDATGGVAPDATRTVMNPHEPPAAPDHRIPDELRELAQDRLGTIRDQLASRAHTRPPTTRPR